MVMRPFILMSLFFPPGLSACQVVLTVSQLMWCREITETLDGDFDRIEAMKGFESRSYEVN